MNTKFMFSEGEIDIWRIWTFPHEDQAITGILLQY